ncbi:hypothetical protein AAA67_002868 [Salmonella enterica subsp. diarizonae]|nr:hypothetical protein [Salmonella enterica subsp. diarizonae]
MSMKPEQSSGELAGLFIRVGNMFFQVAAAGDSCEESLSDKAIPLYAAPPAQIVSIPDDWQTCEKLSDDSYVDNALRELVEDTTGDNCVRVVQAVMRALRDSGLIRTYPDLSQPVDPQVAEYEQIMLQAGNSPVIPDGYALVPVEPTDEMVAAAEYEIGADAQSSVDIWNSMFRAALLQAGRVSSNKDKSESEAMR